MFQETELSYISGNGKPKNLLIFQEVNFRAQKKKKKKFLHVRNWNFLAPRLKNFLYFSQKPENRKKNNKKTNKQTNKKLFFITTNLLLYPVLLSYSFFSYRALNNAPHYRYLTEFSICFTS